MLSHMLRPAYQRFNNAITLISFSSNNTSSVAANTVTKPTGVIEGDLLVAFMAGDTGASQTWTQPSGWTEVIDKGSTPNIAISYKVATDSEPADYTFTFSAANSNYVVIVAYRNAVYDTVGTFSSATDPIVAPAITVAANNSVLLAFYARGNSTNTTWTTPTGMSIVVLDNSGVSPSCGLFSQSVNSGSTGTRSSSGGSTSRVSGILMAIKPA